MDISHSTVVLLFGLLYLFVCPFLSITLKTFLPINQSSQYLLYNVASLFLFSYIQYYNADVFLNHVKINGYEFTPSNFIPCHFEVY